MLKVMEFRLGSKLLHIKQTLLFVLFGLIVGYFSFLTGTILTSTEIIHDFKSGIETLLQESLYEKDWLYDAFITNPERGNKLLGQLQHFFPTEQMENIDFHLFMRYGTTRQWVVLTTSMPHIPVMIPSDDPRKAKLDNLLEKEIEMDKGTFLYRKRSQSILMDVTSPLDSNNYVIQLNFLQGGLIGYIRNEHRELTAYGLFVLLLSVLLGSLFASRLSGPIQEMEGTALQMASGNLDIQLKSNRMDGLGLLARSMNTMANTISHRIQSMQTMNKIDRAVLSSVSRRELMYKVSGYISEQFDNAGISVLEKIPGGYHILATVPKLKELEDRIIKEEEIPEKLRANAEIPFEFHNRTPLAEWYFFPSVMLRKKIFSIPLFQEEHFVGVFIISADSLSNQDRETLKMLSDQAGVALKSLHDMEQREDLYRALLLSLTRSVDAKSRWTAGHSDRVAELTDSLTDSMDLDQKMKDAIHMGALLHDIGKMGVPEAILDKPDRLTDEEFQIIQSHPVKGYEILKDIPDYHVVRQIVRSHHERWDGRGYPDGLAGKAIPLPARIVAIADVFDAVTEDRPYRKGFSVEETISFLKEQKGKIFDPELLDLFLQVI